MKISIQCFRLSYEHEKISCSLKTFPLSTQRYLNIESIFIKHHDVASTLIQCLFITVWLLVSDSLKVVIITNLGQRRKSA